MGTNAAAMREFASTLPAWDRARVLSAADELDELRALSERLDTACGERQAEINRQIAAHAATKRELEEMRARLESAEGALARYRDVWAWWSKDYVGSLTEPAEAHFARFKPGGET